MLHLHANNNTTKLQSSKRHCNVHLPKAQDIYGISWTQLIQCRNIVSIKTYIVCRNNVSIKWLLGFDGRCLQKGICPTQKFQKYENGSEKGENSFPGGGFHGIILHFTNYVSNKYLYQ